MTPRHVSWALTLLGIGTLTCWWLLATSEYVLWAGMALIMAATIVEGTWPKDPAKKQ